jgi:hypothetical protein
MAEAVLTDRPPLVNAEAWRRPRYAFRESFGLFLGRGLGNTAAMKFPLFSVRLLAGLAVLAAAPAPAAEVFELGVANFDERPKGREADAIVGDFVIRNDKIEAVISGNLPLRRANMSTFYGDDGITPGCLYDLTLLGADNDQITIFAPSGQRGPINHVRIVSDGTDGEAVIETFTSAEKSGGLLKRHEYRLKDGWQGLLIVTTFTNRGTAAVKVPLADNWTQMKVKGTFNGIHWADAIDPADKTGYAHAWVAEKGAALPEKAEAELAPGASVTVARFLAVATSPAGAVGVVEAFRSPGDAIGRLSITLTDAQDQSPVIDGRVLVGEDPAKAMPAYPDAKGGIELALPAGEVALLAEDIGRAPLRETVKVEAGSAVTKAFAFGPESAVAFEITDEAGRSIPCKAQFNALGDTAKVNLGPVDRARGSVDQYFSESGKFRVSLPPGKYEVVVTHGPEYEHRRHEVDLAPGATHTITNQLARIVKTPGWVSTDFHNHSTPSGDNTCGTDDRLINLAAEQVEFAPTTEHNRLYDWAPNIGRLGLAAFLKTVPGMELTGSGAHFNSFPFVPDPKLQDWGAPVWKKDPRLNAITLRDWQGAEADRWIHVNHPDMIENFIDRDKNGQADGGFAYFGALIDGLEVQNYSASEILATAPYRITAARAGGPGRVVSPIREFIWLQLLNQGLTPRAIAVCDAHQVHGNGVGGWRTYVKSSTDDPEKIDWREISRNAKAGRMILSTGPFLEVETGAGVIAGGLDRVSGEVDLKVRVQCGTWIDIDRVQVLVNGRQMPEYNFTREKNPDMFQSNVVRFDQTLKLNLQQDAHLIVVAIGEKHTLVTGFGSSPQSKLQPVAYNNPIFIDVDGGGFRPNGDTLGFDLPVGGLSVDDVRKRLGE